MKLQFSPNVDFEKEEALNVFAFYKKTLPL